MLPFKDRSSAGRQLAGQLLTLRGENTVVLGLPRGGVPVAFEVADALDAPLDVIVVRKLGVPFQPELAMGALGDGGVRIINRDVVRLAQISDEELARVERRERAELERRARRFRGNRRQVPIEGRTVVMVDDGIATGSTARAACQVAKAHGPTRVILATPVGAADSVDHLRGEADEVVCLATPKPFFAIGQWYRDFSQTPDEQVVALLERAAARAALSAAGRHRPAFDAEVQLPSGPVVLPGRLTVPERARGIVVFAHGSGSSLHSPRNQTVASVLNQAGLGTFLFDLLTPGEQASGANVFDIGLLSARLVEGTRWLRGHAQAKELGIAYFGASTGAAAALWAASQPDLNVAAVVCRGGRPDLASERLAALSAPTLLIVGGRDEAILALNRAALTQLRGERHLAVVPGATHLFEEPGALNAAAELARNFFISHFPVADQRSG